MDLGNTRKSRSPNKYHVAQDSFWRVDAVLDSVLKVFGRVLRIQITHIVSVWICKLSQSPSVSKRPSEQSSLYLLRALATSGGNVSSRQGWILTSWIDLHALGQENDPEGVVKRVGPQA